jgi:hypothetical protein
MRGIPDQNNAAANVRGQGVLASELPYLNTVCQGVHLLALDVDTKKTLAINLIIS